MTAFRACADIIPIQIRENLVVRVHGIPHDLTTAEADKIIGVIRAMAAARGFEGGQRQSAPTKGEPPPAGL